MATNFSPFTIVSPDIGEKSDVQITQNSTVAPGIGNTVDVKSVFIQTLYGETVSLIGVYRSIEIIEDMFSSCIKGVITIDDSSGGLEKFAIRGGETIGIKIAKPNNGDIIIWRQDLVVHKIGESC